MDVNLDSDLELMSVVDDEDDHAVDNIERAASPDAAIGSKRTTINVCKNHDASLFKCGTQLLIRRTWMSLTIWTLPPPSASKPPVRQRKM
jgi:hypothetical protein